MTIKDIAKELGLSPSTISRALNDNPAINNKTKQLVLDYVAKHDYIPNQNARNLVNRRSHMIGFMIPDISDSFFSHAAIGVEEVLYQNGHGIAYSSTERNPQRVRDFLIQAKELHYSGAFLTPDMWSDELVRLVKRVDIPVVSLRRKTPRGEFEIPYVDSDHYGGMRAAVEHLTNLGHSRIGMISADSIIERERSTGYRDSMAEKGLPVCILDSVTTGFAAMRLEHGYRAAREMLEANPSLTAIIASDDIMAIGVLQYLDSIGKSAPEYISVIGCDDRPEGRLFPIQLTTMQQALHELGRQAANMMLKLMKGQVRQAPSIVLEMRLLERRTTGAPRSE